MHDAGVKIAICQYAAHSCRSINTYARVVFGVLNARWVPYASTGLANLVALSVVVGIEGTAWGYCFAHTFPPPLWSFCPFSSCLMSCRGYVKVVEVLNCL